MIVDARSVPPGTNIETEVCIIGGGAAGITLARKFIDAPFCVAVLESGGMELDAATQQLYEGRSIGGSFPDLTTSRLRFFGGTTNHWGGWCLPLDAIDFEGGDDLPHHEWPFPKSSLDPWYRQAQEVCDLGPYDYRPASWGIAPSKIPPPFSGPNFESKILQVSPVHFGPVYAADLRHAPRVTVYLYANAFHLHGGESEAEITELSAKTLSGNHFSVRARFYILAAGGIENARLLLTSGTNGGNGLGNAHDLVGRFFMTHLTYPGAIIAPSDPHMNFDFRNAGTYPAFGGRHIFDSCMGLTASAMRHLQLPNVFIFWSYRFSPVVDAVKALQRVIGGEGPGGSLVADLSKVIGDLDGVATFAARKALFGEGIPVEELELWYVAEQQPNPDSRVMLGSDRDALGMRRVVVDWRLTEEDKAKAAAAFRLLGNEIGRTGFGRLRAAPSDPDGTPSDFHPNEHHMGTTRMHVDARQGVVDENCRVHSVANLYVAGSSVFPTGGANNPTLTIVALALRLANHIKQRLN